MQEVVAALRRAGVPVEDSVRRRAEYASDASLYRVVPVAVAIPRHVDELIAIHRACAEHGVPLTVRGAGTSIAGNAVGPGIVADVSRHLHRIGRIDPEAGTAEVEPGVVLDDLQRAAAPYGLRFGPDPSTHDRCTVGGMIGNNACGSRALRYGRTADNVRALDVLTGSGERLGTARPAGSPTLATLREVVAADLAVIRTEFGRFGRQVSGYSLEHLLPERGFDVARFLVGTEGTCALTLGATVGLGPAPAMTTLVVLGYPDMAAAADAVPALLPLEPVALEGIDARIVDVVRAHRGPGAVPPLPTGAGWLFVELAGGTAGELADAAAALVRVAGAVAARVVTDPAQARALWRIREDGAGLAARPTDGRLRYSGWEDAAVPPERLSDYLRDFEALLAQHRLTGLPYGHFGDGCLHVRLDFPLDEAAGPAAFRRFLLDAARLVAGYGGSLSGEHGDGRARSELLPLMYSAAAIRAMAAVKAVFDPAGILNPGVVVHPAPVDDDLRRPVGREPERRGFGYRDDAGSFARAVHRCTGVGKCRAEPAAGGVMCPSYLATRDEKDSTRGRARVLQELVDGRLVAGWRDPAVRDALDLCLGCKGCASDCPTGVDMATYKAEALHQAYRRRLRPPAHYVLGWLPTWARLAARAPRPVNAVLRSPLAGLGRRLAGVDPRRDLPTLAPQTFRAWFAARPTTAGDPVLLWVDTFTDLFDPAVGRAAVAVLEAAGYAVRIPPEPLCCGLTWISTGQLDRARRVLRRSVAALVAAGDVPVVGLEPSCVAVFRGDAADLLDVDVPLVQTLAELLAARPGWSPPSLTGTTVVAQPHCHHHAVMGWAADQALLAAAGATVQRVGGCCGLAGNFGAERGHYDLSVAVAEHDLLPAVRREPGATVLADGFSCRRQLAELTDRRGRHLAELLAPDGAVSGPG